MPPKVVDVRSKPKANICKWCGNQTTMSLYAWGTGNSNDGPLCESCWLEWRRTGKVGYRR